MSESVNFLAGQKWLRTERHGGRNFPTLTSFGSAQPSMSEFERVFKVYMKIMDLISTYICKEVGKYLCKESESVGGRFCKECGKLICREGEKHILLYVFVSKVKESVGIIVRKVGSSWEAYMYGSWVAYIYVYIHLRR